MNEDVGPIDAEAITSLDAATVDRIAAGEVIERPASVVKELVENSLDADATRITVAVENGGKDAIEVRDDGVGMTRAGVRKAVERHTTSKLSSARDLATEISTLGFRGEALHTIGAVSELTVTTNPGESDGEGTELRVRGGEVESVAPAGRPPGTTVRVQDLFYNTPARREFLNATATEFDHVNRIVSNYALANPDVALTLTHDGRETFSTPGRDDLQETVLSVYGREVAESMLPVDATPAEASVSSITGLVSDPETTRSRARYLSTFVNDRYVRSDRLRDAVLDGYGPKIAPDRYPFVVLFCTLPPDRVDVNVHPRKLEVRFDQVDEVTMAVRRVVRETLAEKGSPRQSAPRGPGQPADAAVNPFRGTTRQESGEDQSSNLSASRAESASGAGDADRRRSSGTARKSDKSRSPPTDRKFRRQDSQRTLDGDETEAPLDSLPAMRILGQLDETYLIATTDDGLILIDQHAADERITFERLRAQLAAASTRQELVEPVRLSVTGAEAAAFEELQGTLESLGFDAVLLDNRTLEVQSVPAVGSEILEPTALRDALADVLETRGEDGALRTSMREIVADMACHPAITGGTRMSSGSMIQLLEELDSCDNPFECPHGRPALIRIDESELEERFERGYPGHATRRPETGH